MNHVRVGAVCGYSGKDSCVFWECKGFKFFGMSKKPAIVVPTVFCRFHNEKNPFLVEQTSTHDLVAEDDHQSAGAGSSKPPAHQAFRPALNA